MSSQRRCVRREKGRNSVPYRAKRWINGQDVDLGRYKMHEEAAAACRAVRKQERSGRCKPHPDAFVKPKRALCSGLPGPRLATPSLLQRGLRPLATGA
jgi:hypothetical protein